MCRVGACTSDKFAFVVFNPNEKIDPLPWAPQFSLGISLGI
jgi:hypothetical protein